MSKSVEAFRTIGEVAEELDVPKHVLRFWEGKFPHIRPMKRGGGRRYYRPEDMELLRGIRHLLHAEGYTIKGVQKILRQHGVDEVKAAAAASAAMSAKTDRGSKTRGKSAASAQARSAAALTATEKAAASAQKPPAGNDQSSKASQAASVKSIVAAAIRELEVCRQLLISGGAKSSAQSSSQLRTARS
jgi:DNA-binding transcriptional MerR regulator